MFNKRNLIFSSIFIGLFTALLIGACAIRNTSEERSLQTSTFTEHNSMTDSEGVALMERMTVKEHLDMYRKFFFEKADKYPGEPLPQKQVDLPALLNTKKNSLKSAWLGHSSLLISIDGYSILTDPVFQKKITPIGPSRFNEDFPLGIEDLPSIDIVIISHDHYDHLNKFSIQQLADKTSMFVVPNGVGARLKKWGIKEEKITELSWWNSFSFNGELSIVATPAQHFSGRGLFDRNKSLWASWVIMSPHHRIFFSGDSGYFDGFKSIGERFGPFDVAFLECGAYNQRWSNVHMFPEQTVQAFIDLKGMVLHPIHMATFNLSLHPWYEPMERLVNEAWRRSITVSTPIAGQVVDYSQHIAANLWWIPIMNRDKKELPVPQITAQAHSR